MYVLPSLAVVSLSLLIVVSLLHIALDILQGNFHSIRVQQCRSI